MSGSFLALYLAYSIVWGGLFAYLAYMFLRQRRIDRDIASLKGALHKNDK